ncbi:MAG: GNAT family N-acetyltransferase [Thaumarchaeota archaeon]|nr:GNAT family N-acetyltransferase [Nitrososphaerota archaeon]
MITIHDKFGKKYRLQFEKTKEEISIYLFDGREKHFVSIVDIYNDIKTAEIQEFILEQWPDDYKHRGLGSIISNLLEVQLKDMGISTIIGDVVDKDKGAEIFWQKQGYKINSCKVGPVRFTIKKEI